MSDSTITTIDLDALRDGVADGTLVVIDVREPHEFAAGAIPGSVSMPLSSFDPAELESHAGSRVVFSCAAGVRSVRAIQLAQAAGLDLHEHFAGGFREWATAGEPITRGG